MNTWEHDAPNSVHCHIGSLEKEPIRSIKFFTVHCHIGSLERRVRTMKDIFPVHCHIGSLEKWGFCLLI